MKNNTPFYQTKSNNWIKTLLLSVILVSSGLISNAQQLNLSFNLLQQPCNNDGILEVQTSTLTPPITLYYYLGGISTTVIINTTSDTIFNYSGGSFYVNGTDGFGVSCYGYFIGSPPFTYLVTSTAAICPALGTADVAITGGTSPYTIEWTDNSTGVIVATGTPANLPAGVYDVLITDASGCVFGSYANSDTAVYIYNQSPIGYNVASTTANCTNGTATVASLNGGVSPYSYIWSNGANSSSITGLMMGQVSVTVTDAQGCFQVGYGYVQQGITIGTNPISTPATCLQNDGSIIAFGSGGLPPYSYLWNNGQQTQTVTGLTAGYYYITVTDANGCVGQGFASVAASTPITATYSSTPSSCTAPTGTATVSATGGTTPYSINWNTFPVQTGTTATNLAPGNYGFNITDAVGCVRTGSVVVSPISIITANVSTGNATCPLSNGSASILVTSGAAPYSYSWNNGAIISSINNVPAGGYSCVISDNLGCSITKYASIQISSPVNVGLATTTASCIFSNDGNIVAITNGGIPPYTYSWSNGETTNLASGLTPGYYSVYVTDANGCNDHAWTNLGYNASNNSCYCTITGKVYEDLNGNCVWDAGETGIQNIMIHATGLGYTFTDANGIYSFIAPSGTYTLSESVQYYYPLAACQSNAQPVTVIAASGCVSTVDFANVINPIHDVQISTTFYTPPIPGNTFNQTVVVSNNGTLTESNIDFGYTHDGQLSFSGAFPGLFTQQNAGTFPNWYSINSGFPTLTPAADQNFTVQYNVATNIPLGTSILFKDSVAYTSPMTNWLNDYTPWNNVNYYNNTVVGSWDPNFKEVSPRGTGAPGYITTNDSVLNYTIHFQNTGTYAAQKVVLIDTLDSNLDITSLLPYWSNHNYVTEVNESGVVKFTFNNINLPDSASNPLGSIGIIMYSIHQKPNLANGTEIKNSASIYFDYNAPVKTNTTLNTIDNGSGVNEISEAEIFDLTVYPNPATHSVSLLINCSEASGNAKVKFYNILGSEMLAQTVKLTAGKNVLSADVSSLAAGMYFVEITEGSNSIMKKLSVVK